jgi:hypothetical protein
MQRVVKSFVLGACVSLAACGGTSAETGAGGTSADGGACALTASTTETAVVSPTGCHVLDRDTSACTGARKAQGLSGFWLGLSCRVSLSVSTQGGASMVMAAADGQPDYESEYFPMTSACYAFEPGSIHNPSDLEPKSYVIPIPLAPDTSSQKMMGGIVGLAANGVPIFGNFAAPGDDIYVEAKSFDRCGGHPQMTGEYHYHGEPYALSDDDDRFIGVMRDGSPIYGRKDPGGAAPVLDALGGHTGTTVDSPSTPVYHYHLNLQTSTNPSSAGQTEWFLTTGTYRGTPAPCVSCN